MLTTLAVLATTLSPILAVALLLEFAEWRARQRETAVARQIRLTDALAWELGGLVAPVVRKPLWGPWEILIAVPFARPATVGTIISVAHRVLSHAEQLARGDYRIVLTPQEEPRRARVRTGGAPAYVEAQSC
jgi:hypothetical protein